MKFRPCIDIHNGKVKQIVGGSLKDSAVPGNGEDAGSRAEENFTSEKDAAWFADLYRTYHLTGGHIILLNPRGSREYQEDLKAAEGALRKWPGGMQIGGGITEENAETFLKMGASHVIVTSSVFDGEKFSWKKVRALSETAGREHLVIDLSCRKKDGKYFVVTNRWQTFTNLSMEEGILDSLSEFCAEFLIHGVDQEGLRAGYDADLIRLLAKHDRNPITYAGGIASMEDIREIRSLSSGKLDFTVGSALDLFGGNLPFEEVRKVSDLPAE